MTASDHYGGESEDVIELSRATSVLYQMKPLLAFLKKPGVTEVCINRPGELFYEADCTWHHEQTPELSVEWLLSLGVAVAAYTSNDLQETRPILSAVLPDGERCQFVMPPACEADTMSLTVRKPSQVVRTLANYEEQGFFNYVNPVSQELTPIEHELKATLDGKDYVGFLKRAVDAECNIIIAGETGSGKTTFMKALTQEIPAWQRIITIEDVPELFLPHHPNRVHLFYPSEAANDPGAIVNPTKLLRSCLRMKPNRILLAEIRGGEAYDFIDVCSSGHGGSITSLHAGSTALAFQRLASMVRQNPLGQAMPYDVLMRQLYTVVDVIVHIHNDVSGHGRHITEIYYDPERKRESRGN